VPEITELPIPPITQFPNPPDILPDVIEPIIDFPPPPPVTTMQSNDELLEARKKFIVDLYVSEVRYVKDLGILIDIVKNPLEMDGITSANENDVLFSNLEHLLEINKNHLSDKLHNMIENVRSDKTLHLGNTMIGQLFIEFANQLKEYRDYCVNQTGQLALLNELRLESTGFVELLTKYLSDPKCRGEPIEKWLSKPNKRLQEYPKFLSDILSVTDRQNEDYVLIQQALQIVSEAVDFVIVNKQKAEEISEQNKQKLIPIQDKFEPLDINGTQISIIKYGRVFESEKDLTILYGKKLKKSKTYHAHLFNDCFLLSTQHKTKYLLEYNYKYKQVKISEREENRIEIESLIDEVKFVCECVSLEEKKRMDDTF